MLDRKPLYVVDIIGSTVAATSTELSTNPSSYLEVLNDAQKAKYNAAFVGRDVNYIYGDRDEINKQLQLLSQGKDTKLTRYPLIALVMPFQEVDSELLEVTLPRLIFATVTPKELLFPDRYEQFFKPILYPLYHEFFVQLSRNTVESDFNVYPPTKMDVPKIVPSEKDGITNDYVDAIVITNLKFKLFSPLNCN